jgi:hypothetical protein
MGKKITIPDKGSCSKCFVKSYRVAKPALIEPDLDFAIRDRPGTWGYVPRGRKAEDGRIDDRYNLIELSTQHVSCAN